MRWILKILSYFWDWCSSEKAFLIVNHNKNQFLIRGKKNFFLELLLVFLYEIQYRESPQSPSCNLKQTLLSRLEKIITIFSNISLHLIHHSLLICFLIISMNICKYFKDGPGTESPISHSGDPLFLFLTHNSIVWTERLEA